MISMIQQWAAESNSALERFVEFHGHDLVVAAETIAACFERGGKLLLFGNGGSAADAQHVAAEFVNRFLIERPPLPALALTVDTSVLTSIGNDYSFDDIFVKQIKALGVSGDVALAISTSGQSPNVINAVKEAKARGLYTIGLAGKDGGALAQEVDLPLVVPSEKTPHIQEVHLAAEHILCDLVDNILFIQPGS